MCGLQHMDIRERLLICDQKAQTCTVGFTCGEGLGKEVWTLDFSRKM